MSNEEVEILQKAQDLIRDPANWVQGNYAATRSGNPIGVLEGPACRFCTMGAVAKVMGISGVSAENSHAARLLDEAAQEMVYYVNGAVEFNDRANHANVMDMFERAIALAKAGMEV